MRREADFFGDKELVLLYIAKKLKEALGIEKQLEEAGIDYLVEVDYYTGGIIFRSERAGAFFYVDPGAKERATQVLWNAGYRRPPAE